MRKFLTVLLAGILVLGGLHFIQAQGQCTPEHLVFEFAVPDGGDYHHGSQLTFLATIFDNCGNSSNNVVSADTHFYGGSPESWVECEPVFQLGANAYVCDYLIPEDFPSGYHDASMFAFAPGYPPHLETKENAFSVGCTEELVPTLVSPSGEGFLLGNTIILAGNVADGCGDPVEDATFAFTLISQNAPNVTFVCDENENDGYGQANGWVKCARSTSVNWMRGMYDVDMTVSRDGYPDGTILVEDVFNLGTAPSLENAFVSPPAGPWTQPFTFSVTFTDFDFDTNLVSLWQSTDQVNWNVIDEQHVSGISILVDSVQTFTPEDQGVNYFQFRTIDEWGFSDESAIMTVFIGAGRKV